MSIVGGEENFGRVSQRIQNKQKYKTGKGDYQMHKAKVNNKSLVNSAKAKEKALDYVFNGNKYFFEFCIPIKFFF